MGKRGDTFSETATSRGVSLPSVECVGVILTNQSVEDSPERPDKRGDSAAVVANPSGITLEVYWGYNGNAEHQIHLGETIPFIIPVSNADEITIKSREGVEVVVWYSVIYY